jgi:hypothetical protein
MKMIRSTSKVTFVFWLVTGMFYSGCGELRGVHTKEFVEFDPPLLVMPTSREQAILAKLKDRPDVAKAFESLQEQADNASSRNPSPITTISYEGYLSNHPLRIRTVQHLQDMIALRALIWATIVTGDETYRSQAKAFLLAWARSYRPTGNEVNENKLDSCFFAYYVLKDFLREAERKEVAEWFETIGTLHQKLWPIAMSSVHADTKEEVQIRFQVFALASDVSEELRLKEDIWAGDKEDWEELEDTVNVQICRCLPFRKEHSYRFCLSGKFRRRMVGPSCCHRYLHIPDIWKSSRSTYPGGVYISDL